jgi:hypothetical protein
LSRATCVKVSTSEATAKFCVVLSGDCSGLGENKYFQNREIYINIELLCFHFLYNIIACIKIKKVEMDWTFGIYDANKKCIKNFACKTFPEEVSLEISNTEGILK